ncbi:hypothetical protein EST38_g5761 [Candolleomyces aberdarensis]|uniref:Nephrocystin 3-like N-terminal domain-containing protein n=1 Tax=Candolleomyces aberdarensis TaxID=2316362 RepID=A0A4Q2DLK4_9AGAR|nr:hypothetical protein EST38_g5761 [Candolleomyces aberdarensis]
MTGFATTLACQLAAAIPEAAPFIEKAVNTNPGLLRSNLTAQLRHLVYEPFKAAARSGPLRWTTLLKGPFLIVIDGLDECEDRKDVQAFIEDMLDFFKKNPLVPLRFLITSRVEQHIQGCLEKDQVRLENLVNHCSRDDIDTFMRACFEAEIKRNPVIKAYIRNHRDWPAKKDKDKLVDHIGGSFVFASALFKYIVDPTDDQSTPMDRLPHTLNMNPGLDTLYAKTLSRSKNLPHFSDIISTLALTFEPLPIIGIAELLGIEAFEVVRVLVNLQAIVHIPGTDDLPVTMCHTSFRDFLMTEIAGISELLGIEGSKVVRVLVNLRPVIDAPDGGDLPVTMRHTSFHQFLTTESRSGRFFVSPAYHLRLSYNYFSLNLEHMLSPTLTSPMVIESSKCRLGSQLHWENSLKAISEQTLYEELDQLTHLPSQTSPYRHIFLFARLFLWVFQDLDPKPQQILPTLTRCIESLASALECDHAPEKWLQYSFNELLIFGPGLVKTGFLGTLEIHQDQAMALQHNVQHVKAAIRAKGLSHHLERSWDRNVNKIHQNRWLGTWTVRGAYRVSQWIFAHAEAGMRPAGAGVVPTLDLHVKEKGWDWSSPVIISIQACTQPPAT